MKKILLISLLFLFSTSSFAQVVYYYGAPTVYVQPAPVIIQQPVVVQQPIIVQQPVVISPPVCATYVDPYDLFGQLFGNPDLVQVCY